MRLCLFVLFLISIETNVLAGPTGNSNIQVPSFNLNSINLGKLSNLQETYFEKKLVHKPQYFINTYLGTFRTSFAIDLPKNAFFKDGLWFDYNTGQSMNLGYGIGFDLRLPKIRTKNGKHFYNLSSSNELLVVNSLINVNGRLEKLKRVLGRSIVVLAKYRLSDEDDFSLFLKTSEGMIQLRPSGETFIFNGNGLLVTVLAANDTALNLDYNDHRLVSLNSATEGWSAALNYMENEAQVKFIEGQFVQVPRGIVGVRVKQGPTTRQYDFDYKSDLLVSVKKEGALNTVFLAEYKIQKGSVTQLPFSGEKISDKTIVFKSYDKSAEFETASLQNEKQIIQLDLNGDFVTDEIAIEFSESSASSERQFKEYFAKVGSVVCDERCAYSIDEDKFNQAKRNYENYLNSKKFNVSVRFGSFAQKTYALQNDPALNLSLNISDLGQFSFAKASNHALSLNFTQSHTPRFMDINSDGKKDLVLCSSKAEKNFVEQITKQDILVQSVFNLVNKPTVDNIFNYNGESPQVYLFRTNEEKLFGLKIENSSDIYHILNVSSWEKISSGFKCHSQSMQIDFNQDGISDVLTGKTIYLMGDNGEARAQILSETELKKLFNISGLTEESLSKIRYGLIDGQGDGVWEAFVANNFYIRPTDRKLHILSNDKDLILERPSEVPYLSALNSTYGGKVKISYGYVDGAYVVKKVNHDVEDIEQNNWEEKFNYEGSRWHVQKNIFLGFKKGIVEKSVRSNKTNEQVSVPVKYINEFDLDDQNGPIFYLGRARKAGRVVSEQVFDQDGLKREVKNKYIDHEFVNRRTFSFLSSQEIMEKGKSKITKNFDYPLFENEIPLKMREQKKTGNISEILFSEQVLLADLYLLRPNYKSLVNHLSEKRLLESNTWDAQGRLLSRQAKQITETFAYDNLGRVQHYQTSNGKVLSFNYVGSLPLVASITDNQLTTKYLYNDVENNITSMTIEGSPEFSFQYWSDGVLKKINREEQIIFQSSKIGNKLFETKKLDETFRINVDGFGRLTSKIQLGEGDNLVLTKNSLDDEDRPIQDSSPYFEESFSPSFRTQRKFDGVGNLVFERAIDEQENLISQSITKIDQCFEKTSELGFFERVCKDGSDQTLFSSIPNEESQIDYGFSGEVKALKPFGYNYLRNNNGEIIESASLQWGKLKRTFDYKENKLIYNDGVQELKNPNGEFKGFTNGLMDANSVSAEANYNLQLMTSLTLKLGNQSFTHRYGHNASRALISKQEFNTKWKFELDEFDRVKEESVTDSKNSYHLSYVRQRGVINSIAPFITNIAYSPLMKPILIEYANGASAEYIYGPKGELISYSLTRGTTVFYNLKNTYRRDLRLSSQSILTSEQLEEQVNNFTYDSHFELANSNATTQFSARDLSGQISKVNDLDLKYHHLNLIHIQTKNSSITNFHGTANKFLGSCDQFNNCFYKISENEVEYLGEIQKLIVIGGVPVGLLYKGSFFPVIIDHKMAVTGLLNADASGIRFLRSMDEWGNNKQILGDQAFEKLIAFSYSRLLQNPLLEKSSFTKLYFSETRAYSPKGREWLSPDSTIIWSPEKLIAMPGNWNPFKYANNDPVNYIDASGQWAVGVVAGGVIGGVAGAISAAALHKDVMEGALVGGTTGMFYGSGVGLVTSVVGLAARASVVGIFTFTGNLLGQALITRSVSMIEATTVTVMSPFSFGYSNLFSKVSSELVKEIASGLSFMPVDLAASFASNLIEKKGKNLSQNSSYEMGNYKLITNYGN